MFAIVPLLYAFIPFYSLTSSLFFLFKVDLVSAKPIW